MARLGRAKGRAMTGRSPPTVGARPDTPGPPLGPRAGRDGPLPRLPALDGLRGAAVVAVLASHSGISWARGGFLGVDTFFVLSGYLITALLLGEWSRDGRIRLRAFWARRARRLLPALLLMLLGVAVYAAALTTPDAAASVRLDALSTLGYVANWRFAAS